MQGDRELQDHSDNPKQSRAARLWQTPRCHARTRSGKPCRSPAVKGSQRCRMHGGKGSGAPKGNRNAWKHGGRSAETRKALALVKALAKMLDDEA